MQSTARDQEHTWQTSLTWVGESATLKAAEREDIGVTIPPEFGGPGTAWSPEELLIGAALACTVATFSSLARRRGIAFEAVSSSARGTVARSATGLSFSAISLELRILIEEETQRQVVVELVERAHRGCIVSGSLRCPVTIAATVEVMPAPGGEARP